MDNGKNSKSKPPAAPPKNLGDRLRELSDKVIASGVERLSADQIEELVSSVRAKSV
jgi:hypothetical protein